mgnify:CR=1 FL=1
MSFPLVIVLQVLVFLGLGVWLYRAGKARGQHRFTSDHLFLMLWAAFPIVAFALHHKPWMGLSLFVFGVLGAFQLGTLLWPNSRFTAMFFNKASQPATEGAPSAREANPATGGSPRVKLQGFGWGFLALIIAGGVASWIYYAGVPDAACIFCVKEIGQ